MIISGAMTAAERQRWYWMKEIETCNKKMRSCQENSPEYIQWEKQYKLACKIYNRLSKNGELNE